MIVEEIMKTKVATLFPTDSIDAALRLMESKKIRHVPIIDSDEHLVGLVTAVAVYFSCE
jgi:acetoin utilization protein AcuB